MGLYRHFDFFVEIVIFIVFQRKAVFSEFIEIGYILYNHLGCGIRLFFYNAFYCVDMSVVDMCIRYDVYKLACLKSRRFCEHYQKCGILAHVPVVRSEHIL